jgi:hypothetical protein
MAGSRTLKLSILADVNNLTKGLNSSTKDVETFGDKITKFGKLAGAAFLAAGVAAAAFAVKFAKDAIVAGEAAATANARIEQINKSMGLFGESVSVVSDRLIKYAEETARATGIDTNSIKATQAKLLTFKELAATADEVGGQFDRATKAAIDLASAGFGAAETNAVQLGKALNDPIKGLTALARSGVTFTEQEKERIKTLVESNRIGEAQAEILKAIETQVGGTSEATANATDKMKVGFQQVTERVGIALLPILEKFTNFLLNVLFPTFEKYVLPVVEQLTAAFSDQGGGLGHTVAMAAQTLKSIFMPIWNGLVSAFNTVKKAIGENIETFKTFGSLIATYIAPVIGTVLGGALNIAGKIAGGVIDVIAGVVKILNGLIQGAIAGINGLISAYNAIPFLPNVSKISAPKVSVPAIQTPSGSTSIPSIPSIPTLTTSGATASSGGGGGGVSTATKAAATAAAKITGLGASGVSGVSTTSLAGIMSASGTTIINVSGAIDKEGTARTIVDTLNNSFYRGTGGASNLIAI